MDWVSKPSHWRDPPEGVWGLVCPGACKWEHQNSIYWEKRVSDAEGIHAEHICIYFPLTLYIFVSISHLHIFIWSASDKNRMRSLVSLMFTWVPREFFYADTYSQSHAYGYNLRVCVCAQGNCMLGLSAGWTWGHGAAASLSSVELQGLAHPRSLHAALGSTSSVILFSHISGS